MTDNTGGVATCYALVGQTQISGVVVDGNGDILCAVPEASALSVAATGATAGLGVVLRTAGATTTVAPSLSLDQARQRLRRVVEQVQREHPREALQRSIRALHPNRAAHPPARP